MLFMGELLFGQKYYFYGLMPKSRLKLLFLQKKINPMKKQISFVLLVLLGIVFPMRAQVTIKIETLSKPDSLLSVQSPEEIFKTFIEEDAGVTDHYDELMALLVRTWRTWFREDGLPFLFVQLPMWIDAGAADTFRWAMLRKAQARVRDTVPGTGMICLLDQGEYGNIHPTAKRPVGERLADLAVAMLYGGGDISPRATGLRADGDTLTVFLSAPVQVRGSKAELLEIADETGSWVPAAAEVREDRLLLRSDGLKHPVHARYAWTDYSDRVTLFGKNGLPLEPFDL